MSAKTLNTAFLTFLTLGGGVAFASAQMAAVELYANDATCSSAPVAVDISAQECAASSNTYLGSGSYKTLYDTGLAFCQPYSGYFSASVCPAELPDANASTPVVLAISLVTNDLTCSGTPVATDTTIEQCRNSANTYLGNGSYRTLYSQGLELCRPYSGYFTAAACPSGLTSASGPAPSVLAVQLFSNVTDCGGAPVTTATTSQQCAQDANTYLGNGSYKTFYESGLQLCQPYSGYFAAPSCPPGLHDANGAPPQVLSVELYANVTNCGGSAVATPTTGAACSQAANTYLGNGSYQINYASGLNLCQPYTGYFAAAACPAGLPGGPLPPEAVAAVQLYSNVTDCGGTAVATATTAEACGQDANTYLGNGSFKILYETGEALCQQYSGYFAAAACPPGLASRSAPQALVLAMQLFGNSADCTGTPVVTATTAEQCAQSANTYLGTGSYVTDYDKGLVLCQPYSGYFTASACPLGLPSAAAVPKDAVNVQLYSGSSTCTGTPVTTATSAQACAQAANTYLGNGSYETTFDTGFTLCLAYTGYFSAAACPLGLP